MSSTAWGKWFWADWLADPGLRACSIGARGMWMDLLCVAATAEPPGYVAIAGRAMTLDEIARLSGIETAVADQLVSELKSKNVCSQTEDGTTLYSRRMLRDHEADSRKGRCEQCGKSYKPRRSDSRYCSNGCRQQAYRNRTDANRNRNANRQRSVTLSVSGDTDNVTDTAEKDKQNQSCYGYLARARVSICQKESKNLPCSVESESTPQESKINGHPPTPSGPATALPDGRAGPPSSDSEASKRPHELTKAEFEAKLDAKRKSGEP